MLPHISERPSPNHRARGKHTPRLVVLHADASPSVASTLSWCCDPKSKVSYHYLIGRTGSVYRMVPEHRAAYHAGRSQWRGQDDGRGGVNDFSIGVCLSNKQDGKEEFSDEQLDAAALVVADMAKRHKIPLLSITTHADVALPKGRKRDPSPAGPFLIMDFIARVQEAA
jgi:N-acetylmuramoyl-L-alanine amidase